MRARLVVVVTVLLAAARAQAQPASLPVLDVPYVSQSEALCGGAAAAMVLRYWGERGLGAESFASLVDRSAAGIRTSTLVADLTRRGWRVTPVSGNDQLVAGELANGRPVLALIEDHPGVFHYIVIVGLTPAGVIFHDPARAPFRVMTHEAFDRRSRAADRWMAVILPGRRDDSRERPEAPRPPAVASGACEQQVAAGIAQAQANDLVGAERTLTAALSCPGAAPLRELAGVRLLQQRWEDVEQLAGAATAIDRGDDYSWRLLGTSRFLREQPLRALDAWNVVGEPRLDLIRVNGLERTRQRPVERLLSVEAGRVISAADFVRAQRSLRELPAALSTRLELVPVPRGLAELHATIAERPLVPRDPWSYVAIGATAGANRTLAATVGSITGGGESVTFEWRFWPQRPRIAAAIRAPAPWRGTWGVDLFDDAQEFTASQSEARRGGGRIVAASWLTDALRLELRAGAERWKDAPAVGTAGLTAMAVSRGERLAGRISLDGWRGTSQFGTASGAVRAASHPPSPAPANGFIVTGLAGAGTVTRRTPLDLWVAGDTGHARPVLLRAHPVLDSGRMRVERLGRNVLFGSVEAQRWWQLPGFARLGGAVFVDGVRTGARLAGLDPVKDVDLGVGLRVASLLLPGRIQLDVAHGLSDGANAVTLRYALLEW